MSSEQMTTPSYPSIDWSKPVEHIDPAYKVLEVHIFKTQGLLRPVGIVFKHEINGVHHVGLDIYGRQFLGPFDFPIVHNVPEKQKAIKETK